MKKLIAIALAAAISPSADAGGYLVPLGEGVVVEKYLVHQTGGLTLWVSGISNPDGCGGIDKVHLDGSLSGHKTMVAAILAAHASGRKIGMWSSGCAILPFWGGSVTYPIIRDIWVAE